jgi:hypothetical protein
MNFYRLTLFVVFITKGISSGWAQFSTPKTDEDKTFSHRWDLSFEQGAMLGNGSTTGDQLANSVYYNGIDLHFGFIKNDDADIYNIVYRRPTMGIGWYASTFQDASIGKPNALYYYFDIPILGSANERWSLSYLGAFGLSYNFNPYDEVNNPQDVFIGSYRNCYVNLACRLNYRLNSKWQATGSLGFKHFSNGSFHLPNSGINLIPVALGISYKPSEFRPFLTRKAATPMPEFIKHNQMNVTLALGSKNYEIGDPNYLKMVVGVNWLRAIGYKYRAGVGVDLFYSAGVSDRFDKEANASNSLSYAVVGSWEWVLTKNFYVPIGLGVYLHRNELNGEEQPYYERVGVRYRFNSHLSTGVTIKAHAGVADIFEWTLGYSIFNDPNDY